MIRRLVRAFAVLVLMVFGAGCVSTQTSRSSDMTILFIPVYDDAHPMMNGMGNSYNELRWFSDPDSHPAVRPRPAVQPAAPASSGARIDAPAGDATGSVSGAMPGPCRLAPNQGTPWGAIGGGLVGSLFGNGRWRDFWIALGVAGGALRGTEMVADGRRCG